ncbi:TPA: hypothetical protein L1207_004729 [Escherichia coli]|uniref:hypothetical protein n=1 Tax=Escherichia coli TaxID=562 RepID=UPI00128EBB08|nr:hypothetical protein [Escherichia coli]HBN1669713.1 hypothetical protein [Escherichia coli]
MSKAKAKSVVNGKSKRVGVRVPLEHIPLIEKAARGNDSQWLRAAIKEKLERDGILQA